MDVNIKVNSIEQNTAFEKEEKEWAAPLRIRPTAEQHEEQKGDGRKPVEHYLEETDIKRLIYQAIFVILIQDQQTSLEEKTQLLKILQTDMAKYNLRELVDYIDRTIDTLWAEKKLSQENFGILQAFKKIKDKVTVQAIIDPTGLDQELAELEALIHGRKIDILHDLA
jgi:hypothetical protein